MAQNTCGVNSVHSVPPEFVAAQLDAVLTDVRIDSAKIGMLSDGGVIRTVAEKLRQYPVPYVVLDTVMLAKSGDPLLKAEAVDLLISELLPHVSVITPNLPEAAALLKTSVATDEKMMLRQGEALMAAGANAVLLKGGHLDNAESPDWLFLPDGRHRFTSTRIPTKKQPWHRLYIVCGNGGTAASVCGLGGNHGGGKTVSARGAGGGRQPGSGARTWPGSPFLSVVVISHDNWCILRAFQGGRYGNGFICAS
ncbi:Hydroxymethylpyrimidine/phosphomethylpyrimidine kinase [Morganella morganii]|nr:Hydroxymethylpyrimidine/phosphomethylpyrimidine kinase [Morganella morganii]